MRGPRATDIADQRGGGPPGSAGNSYYELTEMLTTPEILFRPMVYPQSAHGDAVTRNGRGWRSGCAAPPSNAIGDTVRPTR